MIHPATPGGLFVSLRRPSRGPAVSCFVQACLFKVMFVYAEAGLCETCAGSAPGSFHRGSILFLIKWHSLAGGLAGTQLPGKPKNAALHLATNSFCLRRRLLRSSMLQLLRPVCVRARVCVSIQKGHGWSSQVWHGLSLVDVYLYPKCPKCGPGAIFDLGLIFAAVQEWFKFVPCRWSLFVSNQGKIITNIVFLHCHKVLSFCNQAFIISRTMWNQKSAFIQTNTSKNKALKRISGNKLMFLGV